jgi:Flp pilus assembly protein TadD
LAQQQRHAEQLAVLGTLEDVERPPRARTAWSQGQALFNLGRVEEAEIAVDRCLTLAPGTAGCWLLRANVLDKQGRRAEALAAFEQAQALRAP